MAMPSEIPPEPEQLEVKLTQNRSVVTLGARWSHTERLFDIVRWYAAQHNVTLPDARRAVLLAILETGIEMCEQQIWPTNEEALWSRVGDMAKNAYTGERDQRTAMAEDDPRQAYVLRCKLRRIK